MVSVSQFAAPIVGPGRRMLERPKLAQRPKAIQKSLLGFGVIRESPWLKYDACDVEKLPLTSHLPAATVTDLNIACESSRCDRGGLNALLGYGKVLSFSGFRI